MLAEFRRHGTSLLWVVTLLAFLVLSGAVATCFFRDSPQDRLAAVPEYNSFLGASEFVVGENRFPFALTSVEGEALPYAEVFVDFFVLNGTEWEFKFSLPSEYKEAEGVTPHIHDDGSVHDHLDVRGQYVVTGADFRSLGLWRAEFSVATANGTPPSVGELAFNVLATPMAPGVGEGVPATRNATVHDVDSIEEIDTRVPADDMHELSVADALESDKPFVVVWSTPMFCTSKICGPVLDEAVRVQGRYGEMVNFVHIEPWDIKTARSEGRLKPTPEFAEWGLTTEPWVFVVDGAGRVAARFEGLVTQEDMEAALLDVLAGP